MPRKSNFREYFQKLIAFYRQHKYIPSCKEAMDVLWVNSMSVTYRFYQQLIEQRYFRQEQSKFIPTDMFTWLPTFESVRAWMPTESHDDNEIEKIAPDSFLVRRPESTFFLKVVWDSMIDAWIMEHDYVVVDTSVTAKNNDIVVASLDNEYTLKYLIKKPWDRLYFQAANSNYQDIHPKWDVHIVGVVTWSFRSYV